jgi:CheY-like chemotaxis protein
MPTHVLVIDDDNAIRLSLSILLEAKGYEVSLAADGAEGFAKFVAKRPDIVISDMIMPGHQGIQTIGEIRARAPDLPIIAMSGSVQGGPTSFLKRALDAGADHCLEKPFEALQLLGLLDHIKMTAANREG